MTDTLRFYVCIGWILFALVLTKYEDLKRGYSGDVCVAIIAALIITFVLWFFVGIILLINQAYKTKSNET